MCFSASASFGAGIVLSVIGVASIKKVQQPSQIVFASIPLLFAIQQITEGFLWISLTNQAYAFMQQFSTYTFLFFAQVLWPVWVPLSIVLLEKEKKRKQIGKILVIIGAVVSCYLAYCLVLFHVESKIISHHISYEQNYPKELSRYGGLLYVIATITPPFFSSIKRMWMLSTAILISYIITAIFYKDHVVSVWCFFAAVISIAVFALMNEIKKATTKPVLPGTVV